MALRMVLILNKYLEDSFPVRWDLLDDHLMDNLLKLDKITLQHSIRTSKLAVILGKKLGLSSKELELLGQGALFHDVGKARIPLEILNKEGQLTPEEWGILQTHPQKGCECLKNSDVDEVVRRIVLEHHLWVNGEGGYPLIGDGKMPCPLTQIVMVADVVDAMTSDRPYRRAHSVEKTKEYLEVKVGSQFNGEVVSTFGRLIAKFD